MDSPAAPGGCKTDVSRRLEVAVRVEALDGDDPDAGEGGAVEGVGVVLEVLDLDPGHVEEPARDVLPEAHDPEAPGAAGEGREGGHEVGVVADEDHVAGAALSASRVFMIAMSTTFWSDAPLSGIGVKPETRRAWMNVPGRPRQAFRKKSARAGRPYFRSTAGADPLPARPLVGLRLGVEDLPEGPVDVLAVDEEVDERAFGRHGTITVAPCPAARE
jgi:hypothetical protein